MLICSLLCIVLKGKLATGITPAMINDIKALKKQLINGRCGGNEAQGEKVMQKTNLESLFPSQCCSWSCPGCNWVLILFPPVWNCGTLHVARMRTHPFSRWTVSHIMLSLAEKSWVPLSGRDRKNFSSLRASQFSNVHPNYWNVFPLQMSNLSYMHKETEVDTKSGSGLPACPW